MAENAKRDENSVPTLIGVSSADGTTTLRAYVDPLTHRLLVSSAGGGGLTELPATGTVNGSNVTFTFTQEPTYIVSDGAWYKKLDNNGNTQWSGTTTVTMVIPPTTSIYGF